MGGLKYRLLLVNRLDMHVASCVGVWVEETNMTNIIFETEENFEYDIRGLLTAFYPGEPITVETEEDCDRCLRFLYAPDRISITLKSAMGRQLSEQVTVAYGDRKAAKSALKRLLYDILSRETGKRLPWGTLTGIRPVKLPMAMLEEGKGEEEIRQFMAGEYYVSPEKTDLSIRIARREREILKEIDYRQGYSLYVGIPFCPTTCLYCSFTSFPLEKWQERVDAYLDSLFREIDYTAEIFRDKKLNAVYIGGGTPTTLTPEQMERLLRKLRDSFSLEDMKEWTVEAGRPDSITAEKLDVIRSFPVDRISINPQTMKRETLDLIGRRHTVEQTEEAFALARNMGFDNINMDLILGLPGERPADVEQTMKELLRLGPDNLTVHSLALKRASRLNQLWEEYAGMTMENTWEMMNLTAHYASRMGMEPYYLYRQKNMAGNFENVGYAAEGKAGIYNILIMEEVQSIVACGAGSVSKRVYSDGRIERCDNVKDVAQYIERVDEMIGRKQRLFESLQTR